MKIETAIGILNKEHQFKGLGFLELLHDIQSEGKRVYSEKTMEAFERFMANRKMFAPVAEIQRKMFAHVAEIQQNQK